MGILKMFRNWQEVEEFDSEAVIFTEGDPADQLYVILAGEVELTLHGDSLGSESKGSIIGEMAMLESATRNATAVARGKVKLAKLDRAELQKMISTSARNSIDKKQRNRTGSAAWTYWKFSRTRRTGRSFPPGRRSSRKARKEAACMW